MHLPRKAVVNIAGPPHSITGSWPRQAAQMQQAQQAWCSPFDKMCAELDAEHDILHNFPFLKAQMLQAAQFQAQLQVHPAPGNGFEAGGHLLI